MGGGVAVWVRGQGGVRGSGGKSLDRIRAGWGPGWGDKSLGVDLRWRVGSVLGFSIGCGFGFILGVGHDVVGSAWAGIQDRAGVRNGVGIRIWHRV